MKIIHTADWHLGNIFHRYDREEEHRHFLDWLLNTLVSEQADALLVCGDVFDTANPSAASEALYYNFLRQAAEALPGLQIVVTAGNHDSAGRIEAPSGLFALHNIYARGMLRTGDTEESIDWSRFMIPLGARSESEATCVCLALPFVRTTDLPESLSGERGLQYCYEQISKYVKSTDYAKLPRIAMGHFYTSGAEITADEPSERIVVGGQEQVSPSVVGKGLSYVALGHIHKAQCVDSERHIYYAGSALPMSFSERNYHHGAELIDIASDGDVIVRRLDYQPLRQLLSLPERGNLSPDEVVEALGKLPERKKQGDDGTWPYLELRIREDRPAPELLADVTRVLSSKAVRFCRMVAQHQERNIAENEAHISLDQLRSISPLEMAQRIYRERFNNDLPEPLAKRFELALADIGAQE